MCSASGQPGRVCFVCGNRVHGKLNERLGVTEDRSGITLRSNRATVSAHVACVRCCDCGGGPVLDAPVNFAMTVRKLALKEQATYQVIHTDCRRCHNCKRKGPFVWELELPGMRKRRKIKKVMKLAWVAFPSGSHWAHRQCTLVAHAAVPVTEPPRKRTKLAIE